MQIIQFKENQKGRWNKFIAENCSEGFLQAWEWGEFQKSLGRKIFRIGVVADNQQKGSTALRDNGANEVSSKLIAVALVVKYDLPFGRSYLYCLRGPVVNELRIKNYELRISSLLFDEIKKISKKEKALFLKFDPVVDCWFHSPEGLWNPDADHLQKGSTALRRLWSQHNFKKSSNEVQPKDTLILDITKSEEELLKEMKQKTRYNIRLAGRKELRIRNYELGIDNKKKFKKYFEEFWRLVEETSLRDKFASHNKNYYWGMLENLNGGFHSPDRAVEPRMQGLQMRCHSSAETMAPSQLLTNNLQAKLYLAEYRNKIIAANIVLYFGDLAVYLHGASSNECRNVMAPYLLQWQQILDAKKAGCKKYDFWGINSSQKFIKSKVHKVKDSWSGITKFKKGFGGSEKKYIGAYDFVFDNIGYRMYRFAKFIKSKM